MKHILLLFFGFFCVEVSAQQLPLFTQYRDHWGIINPASLTGDLMTDDYNVAISASYRNQWVKQANTPNTQTLQGLYIFDDAREVGFLLGGYLIRDETGPTSFTGAYGRLGGIIGDDPHFESFSLALNFGMVQYRIQTEEVILLESDLAVGTCECTQFYPDVGFGLFYQKRINNDNIYAGFSVPQIFGIGVSFSHDGDNIVTQRIQHFYFLAGMYKYIADNNFIEPSIWVKYAPYAPINVDFNLKIQLQEHFWIGGGGSLHGTVHLEAGFLLKDFNQSYNNLRIGYGFDYAFKTYGPAFGASHEINIGYAFER